MIITAADDEASVIDIFLPKLTQADPGPRVGVFVSLTARIICVIIDIIHIMMARVTAPCHVTTARVIQYSLG